MEEKEALNAIITTVFKFIIFNIKQVRKQFLQLKLEIIMINYSIVE